MKDPVNRSIAKDSAVVSGKSQAKTGMSPAGKPEIFAFALRVVQGTMAARKD
jgi:hypothetical protein